MEKSGPNKQFHLPLPPIQDSRHTQSFPPKCFPFQPPGEEAPVGLGSLASERKSSRWGGWGWGSHVNLLPEARGERSPLIPGNDFYGAPAGLALGSCRRLFCHHIRLSVHPSVRPSVCCMPGGEGRGLHRGWDGAMIHLWGPSLRGPGPWLLSRARGCREPGGSLYLSPCWHRGSGILGRSHAL